MAVLPLNRDYGTIDFKNRTINNTMIFRENDTGAYRLRAVIADNGQPLDLTNCTVTVGLRKADKTVIVDSATIVNATIGYVEYTLPNNATDFKGYLDLQLAVVNSSGNRANLPIIRIYLDNSIDTDGAVAPSPDLPILVDLIAQVNNILSTVMLKSVYDANENGIVDNSERLNNQLPSYYLDRQNHTGTQAATTITGLATVATSGDYSDLLNPPTTITQQQADDITANNAYRAVGHIPLSQRGVADGVATLNGSSQIPDSQVNLGNRDVTELNDVSSVGRGAIITADEASQVVDNTAYRNVGHIPLSQRGTANGVATLDASGNIPVAQINIDTDNVPEGSTNQYYTEERVTANTTVAGNAQNIVNLTTRLTNIETVQDTPITQSTGVEHYPNAMGRGLKELLLLGQTLRNVIDNGVNYANWIVSGSTTKGVNGIHMEHPDDNPEILINLKNSTQYTVIYRVRNIGLNASSAFQLNGSGVLSSDILLQESLGVHSQAITTRSNITDGRIRFKIGGSVSGDFVDFEVYAILEGDQTSQDISSSLAFGLNSVGSPITLPSGDAGFRVSATSIGKNLLRLPSGSIASNGVVISRNGSKLSINGTSTGISRINLNLTFSNEDNFNDIPINFPSVSINDNTDYTVNFSDISGSYSSGGTPTFSIITQTNTVLLSKMLGQTSSSTINTSNNNNVWVYLFIASGTTFNNYEFDVQLEVGATATTFEQYISYPLQVDSPNPLRGIGTVRDEVREVDGSGEILRRIGEVTFDGDSGEAWSLDNTLTNTYRFTMSFSGHIASSQALSNLVDYELDFNLDSEHFYIGVGTMFVFINQSTIDAQSGTDTIARLRTYLAANNLIVQYQLATPTRETIEPAPQLPTFEPTTIQLLNNVKPTLSGRMPTNIAGELQTLANMALINKKEIDSLTGTILRLADKELQMQALADLSGSATLADVITRVNEMKNILD